MASYCLSKGIFEEKTDERHSSSVAKLKANDDQDSILSNISQVTNENYSSRRSSSQTPSRTLTRTSSIPYISTNEQLTTKKPNQQSIEQLEREQLERERIEREYLYQPQNTLPNYNRPGTPPLDYYQPNCQQTPIFYQQPLPPPPPPPPRTVYIPSIEESIIHENIQYPKHITSDTEKEKIREDEILRSYRYNVIHTYPKLINPIVHVQINKRYISAAFWNYISTPINFLITLFTGLTAGQSGSKSSFLSDNSVFIMLFICFILSTINIFFKLKEKAELNYIALKKYQGFSSALQEVEVLPEETDEHLIKKIEGYQKIKKEIDEFTSLEKVENVNYFTEFLFYVYEMRKSKKKMDFLTRNASDKDSYFDEKLNDNILEDMVINGVITDIDSRMIKNTLYEIKNNVHKDENYYNKWENIKKHIPTEFMCCFKILFSRFYQLEPNNEPQPVNQKTMVSLEIQTEPLTIEDTVEEQTTREKNGPKENITIDITEDIENLEKIDNKNIGKNEKTYLPKKVGFVKEKPVFRF